MILDFEILFLVLKSSSLALVFRNEIIEGHRIEAKVYVFDGYLYINRRKTSKISIKKTIQIRPKKGITYKIRTLLKISESHQNTTEKRENMNLEKNQLRSKTKK